MQIDDKLLSRLEDLACIALSPGERGSVAAELENRLGVMARLGGLGAGGASGPAFPPAGPGAFREDEPREPLGSELVLRNAPERDGDMLAAPGVAGQEGARGA